MKNKLSHKRIIAILFALALTLQMAAPGFVWDKSFAEDGSGQQTLLGVEPKEDASGEQKASDAKTSDSSVKDSEEQPDMPPWIDVVVIDGITIKASAKEGALPQWAKLRVSKLPEANETKLLADLEGMRGEERDQVATHIYNVAITDSDSKELKPADNMKVEIAIDLNELSADGVYVRMYVATDSDIKEVDSGKVDVDRETTVVIDITKDAEISKAEEEGKTETGDNESTKEKGKEEEQKDIDKEDTESDTEVEKESKKDSAPKLRATPDTGLFVGTNMAMMLIIAVAVIAGGILAVLSFRRREL